MEAFAMAQCKFLIVLAAILCGGISAIAQDAPPSLGDVARQARQQKQTKAPDNSASKDSQTSKDGQSKDAAASASSPTAKKIITNDEIPSHVGPTATYQPNSQLPTTRAWARTNYNQQQRNEKTAAEQWTNLIQSQKAGIASLQSQIDQISASIRYTGGNCVSGCVQWNERQKQKQDQVESMKSQLEQARQELEQTQEKARRQGYGSSVYDP
jgi:hypothetical protein